MNDREMSDPCPVCRFKHADGGECVAIRPRVGDIGSPKCSANAHYTATGPIEPIHIIEQFRLGFNLACVIKYILRAEHKGQRDSDLEKAINYLWRERYGTWRPSKD